MTEFGREGTNAYVEALDVLDPIVSVRETDDGWKGLTAHGEIYDVKSTNGHRAAIPSEITVCLRGQAFGKRAVTNEWNSDIDDYLLHYHRAIELYKVNDLDDALYECELAIETAPTLRAKFNRAMILLARGRWKEGLKEYWECELEKPFVRPAFAKAIASGLKPWMGEPIHGKRLQLLHAHGFGDTIMMLRFVPKGAILVMPEPLRRIAEQFGTVVSDPIDCDYVCPILHLLHHQGVTPGSVHRSRYVDVADRFKDDISQWGETLGPKRKKRIGVAWNVSKLSIDDYPREVDLGVLVSHLTKKEDVEIHSVQVQGEDQAARHGVVSHEFKDFADCAAMMAHMNEIVSVDTAALHLAGAIGHPKVRGLLSTWHSWRWVEKWYSGITMEAMPCRC